MSSQKQNRSIARLVVGAMSLDGSMDKSERQKVGATLEKIGMPDLIADVGAVIEEDDASFNMFEECKILLGLLGPDADRTAPLVYRVVADVLTSDRFVSEQEVSYLSAMARKLNIPLGVAQQSFKQALVEKKSRLAVGASGIDEMLHPSLKEFLSFEGADALVGKSEENSIEELINNNPTRTTSISLKEVEDALAILGLPKSAKVHDAESVWKETIEALNLPKLAGLGESFVTSALNRITRINNAYRVILQFQGNVATSNKE